MTVQITFPFDDDDGNDERPPFQKPIARQSDPDTSWEAAHDAEFSASEGRLAALKALFEHGPCTDYELADFTGRQQNSIGKRRLDCCRVGLIEVQKIDNVKQKRPGPTGSNCLVWQLTDQGRGYVSGL